MKQATVQEVSLELYEIINYLNNWVGVMTKISNEQLVAALIQSGSVKAAATALGISSTTFYDRMKDENFILLYDESVKDIYRCAMLSAQSRLCQAIEITGDIAEDKSVNGQIRLQACQSIISHAEKLYAMLNAMNAKTKSRENAALFDIADFSESHFL